MQNKRPFWMRNIWGVPLWLVAFFLIGSLALRVAPIPVGLMLLGVIVVLILRNPKPRHPPPRPTMTVEVDPDFYTQTDAAGNRELFVRLSNSRGSETKVSPIRLTLCYSCYPGGNPGPGGNAIGNIILADALNHPIKLGPYESRYFLIYSEANGCHGRFLRDLYEWQETAALKIATEVNRIGSPLKLIEQEPRVYWLECSWNGSAPSDRPRIGIGKQARALPDPRP